jgi:hypothetical protein
VSEKSIEILGATQETACLKKGRTFFQLISTLFCEVKTGFVFRPPEKIVPLKYITLCLGWILANFLQGVLSPKIFAGPVQTYF